MGMCADVCVHRSVDGDHNVVANFILHCSPFACDVNREKKVVINATKPYLGWAQSVQNGCVKQWLPYFLGGECSRMCGQ